MFYSSGVSCSVVRRFDSARMLSHSNPVPMTDEAKGEGTSSKD